MEGGVTLLSSCLKIYKRIKNLKLRQQAENKTREEKYVSLDNRSVIFFIFAGIQIIEKTWGSQRHVWPSMILKMPCDSINRQEIWKALHRATVSKGLMRK
jgi:hypothetical protein